jgi:predicted  nucleic acid-binding Zn-ribbon protein
MTDRPNLELNAGLSDEEKHDLEQMIIDFQKERAADDLPHDSVSLQQQIDTLNERLTYLTQMVLTLDRRIKPLYEAIRLTYQKSEILNQRINTLINSIRTGEPL